MARMMRIPILHHFMVWGIRLAVPRRRVGVALVALNSSRQVLLLRHVFHPDVPWGLPGGWLKRGEAPVTGVLRELHEETGLTAQLGPVVHIAGESKPDHIGIAYMGYIDQPITIKLSPEIIEAVWFTHTQLPTSLNPFVQQAIQTALNFDEMQL
jgi:8-oxo-dGTP diphosphatase